MNQIDANAQIESDCLIADVKHHLHPVTNPQTLEKLGPILAGDAEGVYVRLNGEKLIDGLSGLGCVNVGYGNEKLCRAAYTEMKRLSFSHGFVGQTSKTVAQLSEKLAKLTNYDFDKFFFASTGSDANESAVKLAYYYWRLKGQPKRKVLLSREYAYHGNTVLATALTGIEHYHFQFDLPLANLVTRVEAPYAYRCGVGLTSTEYVRKLAESLEEKIREIGPENVAAFFVEPVQGAGGLIMPPRGYLQAVQEICNRHGVLLIADEVVTGFGKTGSMFAYQHYQFKPDIITMAKGITSSYYPLSAVGLSQKVTDVLSTANEEFVHGFTNSGHPVAAAVALANIEVIEENRLLDNVKNAIEPALRRGMEKLAKHPAVGEARSIGVMAALDFCHGNSLAEQTAFCEKVALEAFARGLVTRPMDPVLGLLFPLISTAAEIDESMTILESAINAAML
ncbi:aspartate aminotransferase family protein [Paraburkholderia denitrificans]|uniref:Aspartate aminotransferase family protein n=1 Tax=Paraburkholderia denitrificans TaxID=694025 RepID=A0ABW0JCK1_9BURK